MKQWIALLCAAATLLCFTGCRKEPPEAATPSDGETTVMDAAPQGEALRLRLVDGAGTRMFTLAGENASDVYTASADELTVYLNGRKADPADLENGMLLTVEAGYELLETWPAQFAGATVRAERSGGKNDYGDLCGLYMTVLEDLWTNDEALNSGVAYVSVDLAEAPGDLTDGEKAAVAWLFAGRHNAQPLTFRFSELKENGYINDTELYWKDGVLLSLKATDQAKQSGKKITFDAEKWRSGTGAIFFTGCTADRGKGNAWEPYVPGGFAIS